MKQNKNNAAYEQAINQLAYNILYLIEECTQQGGFVAYLTNAAYRKIFRSRARQNDLLIYAVMKEFNITEHQLLLDIDVAYDILDSHNREWKSQRGVSKHE